MLWADAQRKSWVLENLLAPLGPPLHSSLDVTVQKTLDMFELKAEVCGWSAVEWAVWLLMGEMQTTVLNLPQVVVEEFVESLSGRASEWVRCPVSLLSQSPDKDPREYMLGRGGFGL